MRHVSKQLLNGNNGFIHVLKYTHTLLKICYAVLSIILSVVPVRDAS